MKTTARSLTATALLVLALTACSTAQTAEKAVAHVATSAAASAAPAGSAGAAVPAAAGSARAPAPAAAPAAADPAAATGSTVVKQVHSPGVVAIDEQLAAGQCAAKTVDAATGEYLPDPLCTPGASDPAVTQDNIESTICQSGYTSTIRPPASDTDKVKVESLRQYGQSSVRTTEFDHLISLELGGANSVSNLWPEPNRGDATGTTNPKDAVENTLHKAVCAHKVTLAAAQKAIAADWVTAVKDLGL